MDGARTYSPSGHPPRTFGAAAFHDPVRDGSGWSHDAPRTPLVQGCADPLCPPQLLAVPVLLTPPRLGFPQGSPRPCARLTSTDHSASSARRLPSYLLG